MQSPEDIIAKNPALAHADRKLNPPDLQFSQLEEIIGGACMNLVVIAAACCDPREKSDVVNAAALVMAAVDYISAHAHAAPPRVKPDIHKAVSTYLQTAANRREEFLKKTLPGMIEQRAKILASLSAAKQQPGDSTTGLDE